MYSAFFIGFLLSSTHGYWDIPEEDRGECGIKSSKLPSYINWREGLDSLERDALAHGENIIRSTRNGPVRGLSVPGHFDYSTFVSVFLGIPYAKPPIGEDRFKPAQTYLQDCQQDTWDATFYRPACPQIPDLIQKDIPGFEYTNEDCLYLNIFQPNITNSNNRIRKYPVLVFIHGGGFKKGSALQYPGLVLAQRDMIVVTINYRLGPLGFMTTGDGKIPGNMGLSDQLMALQWVRDNIEFFNGLKDQITIVGHEAGAASVGIHLLSPLTKNAGLFSRAIMMSGSDLSSWAVVNKTQYPAEYVRALSRNVNCGEEPGDGMIQCLRRVTPMQLVDAAETVKLRVGETAGPFAPVVDFYENEYVGWLQAMPQKLRENMNNIQNIDVMMGFAKDDGATILWNNFSHVFENIDVGISYNESKVVSQNVAHRRGARDIDQVANAVQFLYTWWVNPDNSTARRKMVIDVFTDELYASGVDLAVKSQAKRAQGTDKKIYMYKFDYRSEKEDPSSYWMGAYHNYDVQYLFGWPFMNKTYQQLTSIKIDRLYSELDRNISNGTMQLFKSFAINGNPTAIPLNPTMPWNFRNLTWYPLTVNNLTYFEIDYNSTNEKEYHQSQLAFWQDYIYDILYLEIYTTTPYFPTQYPYAAYEMATYSLAGIAIIVLIAVGAVTISVVRKREPKRKAYY